MYTNYPLSLFIVYICKSFIAKNAFNVINYIYYIKKMYALTSNHFEKLVVAQLY